MLLCRYVTAKTRRKVTTSFDEHTLQIMNENGALNAGRHFSADIDADYVNADNFKKDALREMS